jgi:hypothetical protein
MVPRDIIVKYILTGNSTSTGSINKGKAQAKKSDYVLFSKRPESKYQAAAASLRRTITQTLNLCCSQIANLEPVSGTLCPYEDQNAIG